MLRATTACTFSTSQLPKVVRTWCVLCILTCKCASRHNGVQFFISHLASWVRTRRFSEPTFRPSGATNHWKNTVNRDFPTFSRICIFFLLIFSLLTLVTSAFQLSILSEVSLLNFLRSCYIYTTYIYIFIYLYFFLSIYIYILLFHLTTSTESPKLRIQPSLGRTISQSYQPSASSWHKPQGESPAESTMPPPSTNMSSA